MNQNLAIKLYAGGPGSGCNGPNCGRPSGHTGPHEAKKLGPNPGVRWNWKKYGHLVREGESPRSISPADIEQRYKNSLRPSENDLKAVLKLASKAGVDKEYVERMHDALKDENPGSAKREFSHIPKDIQKKMPDNVQELMKVTKSSKYEDDDSEDEE